MGCIQAHHAKRIISVITTLCWVITSNVCFLTEVGNACEIAGPCEYDDESEHVHDHDLPAHDHDFAHVHDHDSGPCHDPGKNDETDETQLCCKGFGSVVRPSQDSKKIESPLAHAISYLLACPGLVPAPKDLKPRKEFQDTGPPHVVSSVAISLRCCLLGNAPPA